LSSDITIQITTRIWKSKCLSMVPELQAIESSVLLEEKPVLPSEKTPTLIGISRFQDYSRLEPMILLAVMVVLLSGTPKTSTTTLLVCARTPTRDGSIPPTDAFSATPLPPPAPSATKITVNWSTLLLMAVTASVTRDGKVPAVIPPSVKEDVMLHVASVLPPTTVCAMQTVLLESSLVVLIVVLTAPLIHARTVVSCGYLTVPAIASASTDTLVLHASAHPPSQTKTEFATVKELSGPAQTSAITAKSHTMVKHAPSFAALRDAAVPSALPTAHAILPTASANAPPATAAPTALLVYALLVSPSGLLPTRHVVERVCASVISVSAVPLLLMVMIAALSLAPLDAAASNALATEIATPPPVNVFARQVSPVSLVRSVDAHSETPLMLLRRTSFAVVVVLVSAVNAHASKQL